MAAPVASIKQVIKGQVLKNESKGQLGKNWLVEVHEISVTTAGDAGLVKTLTCDIANPQFVGIHQAAGAAAYTDLPVCVMTPAIDSAAATVAVTFTAALTGTDKVFRVKIEGY